MDWIIVLLSFAAGYGIFLLVAYLLARIFFPAIEIHDSLKDRKAKARPSRSYLRGEKRARVSH